MPRTTLRSHSGDTARLQLEKLEKRDLLTTATDTPLDVAEAASGVMQASQMSAFFQQSALYAVGTPTSDPTVTWAPKYITPVTEMMRGTPVTMTPQVRTLAERMEGRPGDRIPLLPGAPNDGPSRRASTGRPLHQPGEESWPSQVYAPFVEIDGPTPFDLEEAVLARGIKHFNLAFVTADEDGHGSWSGRSEQAIDGGKFDLALRRQIREVRALGGDAAVSFGGPRGTELAAAIDNVGDLTKAYRGVIEAYRLHRIDFDLSGVALHDTAAIARRNEAISRLQDDFAARGERLDVWFTLPASPQGLDEAALDMLRSAVRHGVHVDGVNIKPTGYTDQPAGGSAGKMGLYTIQGAINVCDQLQKTLPADEATLNLWHKVGITPTVGVNDHGDRYDRQDAEAVSDFARQEDVGMVGLWSLNNDGQMPVGFDRQPGESTGEASSHESIDFSEIFRALSGSN